MSRAALHQRESSTTPAPAFIFFFHFSLSLALFKRCGFPTRRLGRFKSHFILSDPSEPYSSQANPQYRHIDPMKFFWAPPSRGLNDLVQHIFKWAKQQRNFKDDDSRGPSASPCMWASGELECPHVDFDSWALWRDVFIWKYNYLMHHRVNWRQPGRLGLLVATCFSPPRVKTIPPFRSASFLVLSCCWHLFSCASMH